MAYNLKKLAEIAKPRDAESVKQEEWRKENREWLVLSQEIALSIFFFLKKENMTQKELAEKMGVSPTYVGKLLKGKENLTLETIVKIQQALGHSIIQLACNPYEDMNTDEADMITEDVVQVAKNKRRKPASHTSQAYLGVTSSRQTVPCGR